MTPESQSSAEVASRAYGREAGYARREVGFWVCVLLVLALFFATHAVGVGRYPVPWDDEGTIADAVRSFATTGQMLTPHFVLDRELSWKQYYYFPVPLLSYSAAARVSGGSLDGMREASVIAGALLVLLVMLVGRRVGGRKVGVIAGVVAVFDAIFLVTSRQVRPDVFAALMSLVVFAVYLWFAKGKKPSRFVWVGVAGALAFQSHVYGSFALAAVLVAELWESRSLKRTMAATLWAAVGFFVALVPYLIWASRDLTTFRVFWFSQSLARKTPGLARIPLSLWHEPERWAAGPIGQAYEILYLIGIAGLLRWRWGRQLGVMVLTQVLLIAALLPSKADWYYLIAIAPLCWIGCASYLAIAAEWVASLFRGRPDRVLSASIFGVFAATSLVGSVAVLAQPAVIKWFTGSGFLHTYPILFKVGIVGVAAAWLGLLRWRVDAKPSFSWSWSFVAASIGISAAMLAGGLSVYTALRSHGEADLIRATAAIDRVIPPGAVAVSEPVFLLAPSHVDWRPIHTLRDLTDTQMSARLKQLDARYLVVDEWIRVDSYAGTFLGPAGAAAFRRELSRAKVVGVVHTSEWGDIIVYELAR